MTTEEKEMVKGIIKCSEEHGNGLTLQPEIIVTGEENANHMWV
jgi:hypothetical protein